jgi:hypothetical protein
MASGMGDRPNTGGTNGPLPVSADMGSPQEFTAQQQVQLVVNAAKLVSFPLIDHFFLVCNVFLFQNKADTARQQQETQQKQALKDDYGAADEQRKRAACEKRKQEKEANDPAIENGRTGTRAYSV